MEQSLRRDFMRCYHLWSYALGGAKNMCIGVCVCVKQLFSLFAVVCLIKVIVCCC